MAIVPDLDLVVVANCRWRGLERSPGAQSQEVHRFLRDSLVPLIAPEMKRAA